MIYRTTKRADAVLAVIDDLISDTENEPKLTLCPYQNGREHGWALLNFDSMTMVSFSENRNSDQIVIYFGAFNDFDINHIPAEKAYKKAEYFAYDGYVKAAERIIQLLT